LVVEPVLAGQLRDLLAYSYFVHADAALCTVLRTQHVF
jgi:hypothetical protein